MNEEIKVTPQEKKAGLKFSVSNFNISALNSKRAQINRTELNGPAENWESPEWLVACFVWLVCLRRISRAKTEIRQTNRKPTNPAQSCYYIFILVSLIFFKLTAVVFIKLTPREWKKGCLAEFWNRHLSKLIRRKNECNATSPVIQFEEWKLNEVMPPFISAPFHFCCFGIQH